MRKIFHACIYLVGATALLTACKKEGSLLQVNNTTPAVITADKQSVVLTSDNAKDTVLTFNMAVNFGNSTPPITYILQVDDVADTSGASAWGKAKAILVGNDITKYGFTGGSLNQLLSDFNFVSGSAAAVAVRFTADVKQYNGSASTVPTVFSAPVVVSITPYSPSLWVPGAYQSWTPSTAPQITQVAGSTTVYEGYVYIPGTGDQHFKFTSAPDWTHINYGDANTTPGKLSVDGLAGDLIVSDGGYYELAVDQAGLTWQYLKTNWSILGDASPGGWNTDTDLTYDPVNQVWTVTCVMKTAGSFKFRVNHNWNVDFGIDSNGKLQYADNNLIGRVDGINNITVPEDGTYKLTLDLHIAGKYTYSAVKQ